jgi:hypothetical protein
MGSQLQIYLWLLDEVQLQDKQNILHFIDGACPNK